MQDVFLTTKDVEISYIIALTSIHGGLRAAFNRLSEYFFEKE